MNTILDWFIQLDHQVFFAINDGMSNGYFDAILPWCRVPLIWTPFYLFVLVFAYSNFNRRKFVIFLLGLLLTVGLADTISSKLIKKTVCRERPCHNALISDHVHLRIERCGGGYSFTSSHATNHFAVAMFLGVFFAPFTRFARPLLLFWAALIAFSQVYVGVHFPLDVVCGATIGAIIGWLTGAWGYKMA